MKDLTTPQRRILDALNAAVKPIASREIRVASRSYTDVVMRQFRADGLAYIAAWRRTQGNNNGMTPLYLPGNLPDATKPRANQAELRRRKRERQRLQKAADRAEEKARYITPALPTHTPKIGFWDL